MCFSVRATGDDVEYWGSLNVEWLINTWQRCGVNAWLSLGSRGGIAARTQERQNPDLVVQKHERIATLGHDEVVALLNFPVRF